MKADSRKLAALRAAGIDCRSGRLEQDLVRILTSRSGIGALIAVAVGVALFYSLEWNWLRLGLVKMVSGLLAWSGHSVAVNGFVLSIDSVKMKITRECTYVDWVLCVAPFVWRPFYKWPKNLVRLLFLVIAVSAADLLRVCVAGAGLAHGWPFFWVHDFPDYLFWCAGLFLAILFWIRAMRRYSSATEEPEKAEFNHKRGERREPRRTPG